MTGNSLGWHAQPPIRANARRFGIPSRSRLDRAGTWEPFVRHIHARNLFPPSVNSFFDWTAPHPIHAYQRYVIAITAVIGTTGAMLTVRNGLGVLNISLIFLMLIFVLAAVLGSGAAVFSAVLSFLAFNFFLIPPFYTFSIDRPDHVLALFVYLSIAVVTGNLAARLRTRTEIALREQRRTNVLYDLNAALIGNITLDDILTTIVEQVVQVYGAAQCRILLPANDVRDALRVRAGFPLFSLNDIDPQNHAMALWTMEHRSRAGQGVGIDRVRLPHGKASSSQGPTQPSGRDVMYVPIATEERTIGVLEVTGKPGGGRFRDEDARLITSFADQAGLALERARFTEEAARVTVLAQSDELKSALLAAVSHDLRTPLTAIKASVTSLLDQTVQWDPISQGEFLRAINEETDRLTRMVGNLLDLSRIEGGALRPDKAWYDVAELLVDVANRLMSVATHHVLQVDLEPNLPLAHFDYVEIAQVMMNLGENAVKYTSPGTRVVLSARRVSDVIECAVCDTGPGVQPREVARLFEKFYRADASGRIGGTGIGLTISKGLVEAHGGRIWVDSRPGEGTAVRFTLPFDTVESRTL